jgi:hypothetical protein
MLLFLLVLVCYGAAAVQKSATASGDDTSQHETRPLQHTCTLMLHAMHRNVVPNSWK